MFMADISGGLSLTQAIAKHTDIGCILKSLDDGYIPDVYVVITNAVGVKICVQCKCVSTNIFEVDGERLYVIESGQTPQQDTYDFLRISLKNTPDRGYEPMAGGKWYVLVTAISHRWAPEE